MLHWIGYDRRGSVMMETIMKYNDIINGFVWGLRCFVCS